MKYLFLACSVLIIACSNESTTTTSENSTGTASSNAVQTDSAAATVAPGCYAYQTSNNLILLKLTSEEPTVSGQLTYDFLGKDKNDGTFIGKMSGDTLYADYRFMSEGKQSLRQVAFLRRGDSFIEGTGEVEQHGHTVLFSGKDTLSFSGPELKAVPCREP